MSEFVTTNWLLKNINNKRLVIFDCSWSLSKDKNNPINNYNKEHIKNSYFFDIEKISNKKIKLPNMLPAKKLFEENVKNYNIHSNSQIILYSNFNLIGSARVWWMFKYFGFNNVYVLNGGLSKWKKENKPLTRKKSINYQSSFNFDVNQNWLIKKKDIIKNFNKKKFLIIDARNSLRFCGKEQEPRRGLKSGHIPNSKNIFWKKMINNNNCIINKPKILKIFSNHNIQNKKILFTCGSGMTACVLSLSLMHSTGIIGKVYDGSWAEWGLLRNTLIEK